MLNQQEELKEVDIGMDGRKVWEPRLNGWVVKAKS